MISDARRGHVSPGIYTEEKDVTYSVKSLGITSLGLVGETLYGPAFENIEIKNWSEFVDYFGGTSTEKFKDGGLPKYELPYIAKSYLEESQRLNVVRVLGLSGYHAGPAWAIKAGEKIVAILRSKRVYDVVYNSNKDCPPEGEKIIDVVTNITGATSATTYAGNPCGGADATDDNGKVITITVTCDNTSSEKTQDYNSTYTYNLSFNKNDGNYIYKVLSNRPDTGTTPVYVEAVFESSLNGGTLEVVKLSGETVTEGYFKLNNGVLDTFSENIDEKDKEKVIDETGKKYKKGEKYTGSVDTGKEYVKANLVSETNPYDDYTDCWCPARTPYIVSEVSRNGEELSVKELFRFVTISDGDAANAQVKVSIEKIDPVSGTFDVVVRDFNDTDANPMILERFTRCNMVDGDAGYIAYKIGTSDGGFVAKSKYILVEMADGEDLSNSIPAGFEGYELPEYAKDNAIDITYNKTYNPEIKQKKQYFGLSDITGIDADIFSYKGLTSVVTPGFHLDSNIAGSSDSTSGTVMIDGYIEAVFETVSQNTKTQHMYAPTISNTEKGNEAMINSIYGDIKLRKFTVCFAGGFDGWDVHRERRTNTNEYKSTNMGAGDVFKKVDSECLPSITFPAPTAITSDYYAYLAGYRVFANPQDVDINLFATPGINWLDNTLLTEEAIDMIEDAEDGRGGDALYIMASPTEKSADEIAYEFESTEINSSYACTYAPWVMYYDSSNRKYLHLPVTKDVVRNMAATDNNSYPWFAPAGMERGNVNCIKAEYKTTLANEDELYENRVNPVKTFAQDGVKIWGNKTAYDVESPLNRINVRRLMIRVKKLVTNAAKNLIFTQYDDTLEKQFRGLIDPILADVKANRGISDYRIITEVTPETKDQHILPAKILIKPTPALEYISISFVVYPESVSFDEN